jgi:hypothetical protein
MEQSGLSCSWLVEAEALAFHRITGEHAAAGSAKICEAVTALGTAMSLKI